MSDKKPFICPRCKEISGFDECAPTRGWQNLYYDEFGENIGGDNEVSHYYKSRYTCRSCGKTITKAVQRYLGIDEENEKC